MANLTLYYSPGSCSLVPHALMHHLSLPFTTVALARGPDGLEAADGSFTAPWYRANIHHAGYVPALAVGADTVVTEMPAILTYIALAAGGGKGELLLGEGGALERASVAEWLAWLAGTLHGNGFAMLFRPGRFSGDEGAHAGIKEQGVRVVERCFRRIEERVRGREWVVGEKLTVVDFNVYVFARWWVEIVGRDLKEYPEYARFCGGVEGLEGVRKAVQEHGKELLFQ
ncbi:hypothetical protein B5807_11873 [Epicoccum nigrum]|uniref:GST C-terminal domain-containing protein n=1 Tax=Epicoccum nigrum TaxID=105696 RepID=A0A1Y2LKU9_EPING|nr:hypothetical protein B5807_11873 [Epicoccum nigrum]